MQGKRAGIKNSWKEQEDVDSKINLIRSKPIDAQASLIIEVIGGIAWLSNLQE